MSLIPWNGSTSSIWRTSPKREKTEEEKKFQKLRWQWYGIAGLAVLGWLVAVGSRLEIRFMAADELEDGDEDEEEMEDEEEEEEMMENEEEY